MEPTELDAVIAAAFEAATRATCAHGVLMVEWCDDCIMQALEASSAYYEDGGECDL
jgi:hypothetical protein